MSMQISPTSPTPGVAPSGAAGDSPPLQAASAAADAVLQQVSAQQAQKPTVDQVKKAVDNLKQAAEVSSQNIQFSVDHATGSTVISVVDGATNKVIRQIPSEEVLQLAQTLDKLSGLLLNKKA